MIITRLLIFIPVILLSMTSLFGQDIMADSIQRALRNTDNPEQKIDMLLRLSSHYDYTEPSSALRYAEQAETLSRGIDDQKRLIQSVMRQAMVYYILSDLKKAMDRAVLAKELAETKDLNLELAQSLDAIGFIYYEIGDESKSSDCFFQSLKIYEELNEKTGIGQSYCRIGTLYFKQSDNEKAVEYYTLSMNLARDLKNIEGISSNLNNLASVYTSEKEYDRALETYFQALKLNIEIANRQLEGTSYLNIADLYLKTGRLDSAMLFSQKALITFDKLGNQVRYTRAQIMKGEVLLAMNRYHESLDAARTALTASQEKGFKELACEASGLIHNVYLELGDTVNAYRYFLLEQQWSDSLSQGENKKTLARLELQYQFDKREQQLVAEKQRRNFFIIILAILVASGIIIVILLRTRFRLKEKKNQLEKEHLEKDLDYKKKELTLNVMTVMKKNELLANLTKRIQHIAMELHQDDSRSVLRKVARELQKSTEDEIYKEFSLRFKEVHNDFYDALLRKYPGLTPSELRLCAFLRLNMTTKEIAELTGQQISTLENARYRLRQKLGITSSDINLVTFLAQVS